MIKFRKKQDPPRRFDVHKTLPQSYVPDYRRNALDAERLQSQISLSAKTKPKKRTWVKRSIISALLVLLVPLTVFIGWNARNASAAAEKMFGSGNLFTMLLPSRLDNDEGRVNVLLTGFSADDPGHGGAKLTDTIMILSMDKDKKTYRKKAKNLTS